MLKVWLLTKKYWYFVAIPLGFVLYFLFIRRDPRNPPPGVVGEAPPEEPPDDIVATNFVQHLIEKKKANDEALDKLNRKQLIDNINSKYD